MPNISFKFEGPPCDLCRRKAKDLTSYAPGMNVKTGKAVLICANCKRMAKSKGIVLDGQPIELPENQVHSSLRRRLRR